MATEAELHYFCKPVRKTPVESAVEFVPVQDFLADEPACKVLWDLIGTQFRTRSKFLAIWSAVRYVAVHRDENVEVDGLLLVSAPVNWQIDYVVVRSDRRGHRIASALVKATLNQALLHQVPYVMLTSKESLRPLYQGCGFDVITPGMSPTQGLAATG
ncbi:MAG: GNAT family N-acetyltransferase [Bacteroidales bacterium]|nr:GNAT family N-acetyltransferase [Bacteroidales bacterium]